MLRRSDATLYLYASRDEAALGAYTHAFALPSAAGASGGAVEAEQRASDEKRPFVFKLLGGDGVLRLFAVDNAQAQQQQQWRIKAIIVVGCLPFQSVQLILISVCVCVCVCLMWVGGIIIIKHHHQTLKQCLCWMTPTTTSSSKAACRL